MKLKNLQKRIAKELGYELVDHRLELYGVPIKDKNKLSKNNSISNIGKFKLIISRVKYVAKNVVFVKKWSKGELTKNLQRDFIRALTLIQGLRKILISHLKILRFY